MYLTITRLIHTTLEALTLEKNGAIPGYSNCFSRQIFGRKIQISHNFKFEHELRIFPQRHRSKYITRTAVVYRLLIHDVPGSRSVTVPVERGLLHHYRSWNNLKDKPGRMADITVMQKFGMNLIKQVQNVWKVLAHVKMDIPRE